MSGRDKLLMQAAVHAWMVECFGVAVTEDVVERTDRFVEEALELAQATGWTADRARALVDYVFGRPVGEIGQEVGGVMVTLCALCNTHDVDVSIEAWREIDRISQPDTILKIRAKQASKPVGSALPAPAGPAWRDPAAAPKDGTLLTLLVRPFMDDEEGAWTPFEDSRDPQPTIGFNNMDHTGEDRWQFAGWCWSHDHIREGEGEVLGWAPFFAGGAA